MSGYQPRGGRSRGGSSRGSSDRGHSSSRGSSDRGSGFRGGRGGGRGGGAAAEVRVFRDPNVPMAPPDGKVMEIENTFMKNTSGIQALASLSLTGQFPPRPGYGTQGKKVVVYANYFRVLPDVNKLNLTRYNVEVAPELTGKKLKRIFQLLLEFPEFSGVATEWKSLIVSPQPLTISDGHTIEIPYRSEGQDEPLERATVYTVRIVAPTSLSVSDLVSYLCAVNPGPAFPQKAEIVQGLNALFGHQPQLREGIVSIGGNRHFSLDRSSGNLHNIHLLGGGLESLRGYFQSVRPATGGLLLNVNVTHGIFFEPMGLATLYPKLGTGNKMTLQKKLKKIRVEVTHLPEKKSKNNKKVPRVKTIFGLAHPQDGEKDDHPPKVGSFGAGPKDVKFWLSDSPPPAKPTDAKGLKKPTGPPLPKNAYISVFDYFHKRYPSIVLNERLPVLNVGNRENPSYLPAEVCKVLPGQTIKRRLSPEQTQQMITFACRKPWENANSIVGDARDVLGLNKGANVTFARFGLAVGAGLITVAARVLPAPAIKYKDSQSRDTAIVPRFGSWNMANIKFHTGSSLGPWTYIWFRSDRGRDYFNEQDVHRTVMNFKDFLNKSGINANGFIQKPPPPVIYLVDGQESQNDNEIKKIFRLMYDAKGGPRPKFVLVVLPYQDVAIYNSIKHVADTKAGIHTVCVVGSKFMKEQRQDQYFGNVSLKFNLKAGGINQTLEPAKLGIISEGKTMVVGIDVTHPSPGSKDTAPSVAGIVASIDKELGQWPSDFSIQESRKEMVTSLEDMFMSRLRLWEKHNKRMPENVLIYRDGVSEGQYQILLDQELPLIRNACRQVYPAQATQQGFPKISIIVCGKRHHTRFYPTQEAEADRSSNCAPGTVVDRGVTEVRNWDFFLQPHACLQGTARTGHYYVILDEIFSKRPSKAPLQNPSDALEDLTHNMCHLFGRATKAVSLCPPAYYADLLCTRLRCYLSEQFDPADTSATASVSSGTTPGGASGGGSAGSAGSAGGSGGTSHSSFDIQIPDTLKDSMYYI